MAEELANLKLEVIDRSADLLVAANGDVVSAVRSPGVNGELVAILEPRGSLRFRSWAVSVSPLGLRTGFR